LVKSSPAKAGLGAQKLRSEAHIQVRRNDEIAAQRRRWTFYATILFECREILKGSQGKDDLVKNHQNDGFLRGTRGKARKS